MPLAYNIKKNILKVGAKTLLGGVIVMLAFSPLVQSINMAGAQNQGDATPPAPATQTVNTASKVSQLTPQTQTPPQAVDGGCNFSITGNNLAICISNIVYFVMVGLFSSFAYIAAYFFSFAVQLSLNSTAYALSFINISWETTRDLANMAFIFILIYIAFTVMLKAETANTMKMLAGVIVVALVINFSFFLTRVVIDGGNVLAVQFYNLIPGGTIGVNNSTNTLAGANVASSITSFASGGQYKDLTHSIMSAVNISDIFNTPSFQAYSKSPASSGVNGFLYTLITLSLVYVAVGIMFALLAGSFLFAGAKFVMRVVGLWIVIIAAPLALIGRALNVPATKKLFDQWLDALVKYSLYPAIYLFMFYILAKFMEELAQSGNLVSGVFGAAQSATPGASFIATVGVAIAGVAVRMGFVIAMMYVALSGADMVVKAGSGWAKGFQGKAFGAGFIGVAGLGRLAFGRGVGGALGKFGSGGVEEDSRLKKLSRAGAAGVGSYLQNKSYDVRALPGIKQVPQATGAAYTKYGSLPLDLGSPGTAVKVEKESRAVQSVHQAIRGGALADRDIERIRSLNKQDLENFGGRDLKKIIKHLSEKQIKDVNDIEKYSGAQKDELNDAWHNTAALAPLQESNKLIQDELRKIHTDLTSKGVKLQKMGLHLQPGTLIDSTKLKEVSDEIKKAFSTENFKSRDNSLPQKDRVTAGENLLSLQDLRSTFRDFSGNVSKIPDKIGGGGKGEFIVK